MSTARDTSTLGGLAGQHEALRVKISLWLLRVQFSVTMDWNKKKGVAVEGARVVFHKGLLSACSGLVMGLIAGDRAESRTNKVPTAFSMGWCHPMGATLGLGRWKPSYTSERFVTLQRSTGVHTDFICGGRVHGAIQPTKEWNSDTCYNTDGPWNYCAKWKKPDNYCMSPLIWGT